jgi:hypothetical protein
MMPKARIACTAIGKRIVLGVPSKDGRSVTGTPRDVTSDCLKAVIEHIGDNATASIRIDGMPAYEISVVKFDSVAPCGLWCRNPGACAGKGYCPLDPTCANSSDDDAAREEGK